MALQMKCFERNRLGHVGTVVSDVFWHYGMKRNEIISICWAKKTRTSCHSLTDSSRFLNKRLRVILSSLSQTAQFVIFTTTIDMLLLYYFSLYELFHIVIWSHSWAANVVRMFNDLLMPVGLHKTYNCIKFKEELGAQVWICAPNPKLVDLKHKSTSFSLGQNYQVSIC